jgi:hypothetical protein
MEAVLRRQELDAGQLAAIMARVHHPDLQENLRLMKEDSRGLSMTISQLLALGGKTGTLQKTATPGLWLDSSILEEISL